MRLNELPESLIPVHIRVVFMVLQVPAKTTLGHYILVVSKRCSDTIVNASY